ncbi:MAG TPA: phosphoribosylamine--glycine ligase, partial [Gammaproteobacteria bacterium]|nr:phosphoribosylamine--glycine ligase [Gammaproteobacteria bacterium]
AKEWQVGLAIIGPEAPLEKGLANALWQVPIPTIGPKQKSARIETSKSFARDLMQKYNIPGSPRYQVFHDMNGVETFLHELGENGYVIKANGLMGGKGVKVAGEHLHSFAEALAYCDEIFGRMQPVIIEEKLIGQEFSLMCFCDGTHLVPMPVVQDHKRAYVGDKGPNTGGMGSYSDTNHRLPFLTDADMQAAMEINQAVINALFTETREKYIGVLYGSFIATRQGVQVIEFNARFGDPEALNILTILESDLVAICQALITGNLSTELVRFTPQATVCKYAVPEGYPDTPAQNVEITICAVKNKSCLYLSSVNAIDGKIYTAGSRTAAYVGVADSISAAESIAEKEICAIDGPLFHRADIGTDQLIRQRIDVMRELREE